MPATRDHAFFHVSDGVFVGNDAARGPWSVDACHAGPVTAVLARAAEGVVNDKQLVRLTVVFDRPIPMAGFRVEASVERTGRAVATTLVRLVGLDDRLCARATSLHLLSEGRSQLPSGDIEPLDFNEATPGDFPVKRATHGLPFFSSGIDVAYPPGQTSGPGPTTAWMRTVPIVDGETPSPFQTLCPLADCGNGISRNTEITEASCINADLTVTAFRLPQSDWLASRARSFWQPNGIGMSHAMLYDTVGCLGTALQTLIVRPVDTTDDR